MITALIFIIVLSVIIFVHELGHFVMAKKAGMKVEEFGFGFPPRLWGHKPKNSETTYSINWIPFGGFVKIFGEDGEHPDQARSFSVKSFSQKVSVIVAGVVMNIVLGAVLFSIINLVGTRIPVEAAGSATIKDIKVQITNIAKGSPAESAGLQALDEVVGFQTVEEFQNHITAQKGNSTELNLKRGEKSFQVTVVPRVDPPAGEGALGIGLAKTGYVSYPIHEAIWLGIKSAFYIFWKIFKGLGILLKNLLTTGSAGGDVTGPVGIAIITGEQARLGLTYLLNFMAFISLNLAVINILPIPALDGGRLLFLIIEKIKGSPIKKNVEAIVNNVSFMALILLMFFITARDIIKFL